MKNGYRILWTNHALNELGSTLEYLQNEWTVKEVSRLVLKLEHILELISNNPYLFRESEAKLGVRQVVILKYNTMYYRVVKDTVEILSLFSNRQDSNKLVQGN